MGNMSEPSLSRLQIHLRMLNFSTDRHILSLLGPTHCSRYLVFPGHITQVPHSIGHRSCFKLLVLYRQMKISGTLWCQNLYHSHLRRLVRLCIMVTKPTGSYLYHFKSSGCTLKSIHHQTKHCRHDTHYRSLLINIFNLLQTAPFTDPSSTKSSQLQIVASTSCK